MAEETKKSLGDKLLAVGSAVALFGTPQMRASLGAANKAARSAVADIVAKADRWTRYNAPAWAHAFLGGGLAVLVSLSIVEAYFISSIADSTSAFWWNWVKFKGISLLALLFFYWRTSGVRFVPWIMPANVDPAPADYGEPNRPALSAFLVLELTLIGSGIGAIAARSSLCTYNHLDLLTTAPLILIAAGYAALALTYAVMISGIGRFGGEAGDWGFGVGGTIFRSIHEMLLTGVDSENSRTVLKEMSSPFGKVGIWVWRLIQAFITASMSVFALSIFIVNAIVFPAICLWSITTALAMMVLERNGVGMFSFKELNTIERMKVGRAWALYGLVSVLGGLFVLSAINQAYVHTTHPYGLIGLGWDHVKTFIVVYAHASGAFFATLGFFFLTMHWYTAFFVILPAAIIGTALIFRHWHPERFIGRLLKGNAVLVMITVIAMTLLGFVVRVDGQTNPDRAEYIRHNVADTTPPSVAPQQGVAIRAYNYLFGSSPTPTPRGVPGMQTAPTSVPATAAPNPNRSAPRSGTDGRYARSAEFRSLESVYGSR